MKETFYKKVGRKYVPISEYDSQFSYSLPKGHHLISVVPGGSLTRHNIDPNYVAMIAAARVAEEVISKKIVKASEIRRSKTNTKLTPEQHEAWENLVKVFGDDARQLEWPSARECTEAGIKAMEEEAMKLMTVPSVIKAYEQFMLVVALTKDENNESES